MREKGMKSDGDSTTREDRLKMFLMVENEKER